MENPFGKERSAEPLRAGVLGGLFLLLIFAAAMSLRWRIAHDAPLLLYVGWAIDWLGLVSYRDLLDQNPPGGHLLNAVVSPFVGTSDFRFRILDLTLLGSILAATWLALRPFGRSAAAAAALLFGLAWLGLGENQSFQRDGIAVLPLALALLVAFRGTEREAPAGSDVHSDDESDRVPEPLPLAFRGFLVGLAIGGAVLQKPQALIVLPVLVAATVRSRRAAGSAGFAIAGVAAAAGVLVLPVLALLQLRATGALPSFLELAREYWPLYSELDGEGRRHVGAASAIARLRGMAVGATRIAPLLVAAAAGALVLRRSRDEDRRRILAILGALLVALLVYVFVAGKSWKYHFLPATWAACLLAGFAAEELASGRRRTRHLLLLAVGAVVARPPDLRFWTLRPLPPVKDGKVEFVASYLRANLRPGDAVQPLDSAGGALHAMYLAGAPPATRILADFHLYHHVSHPYVRKLRAELVRQMAQRPPRFVVHVGRELPENDDFRPSGEDCGGPFPELSALLADRYRQVAERPGVHILERIDR